MTITLAHNHASPYQVWLQKGHFNCPDNGFVIKPSLWLWPWNSAIHFFSLVYNYIIHWCASKVCLVAKGSAVQKVWSWQTQTEILQLSCDLNLKCSNTIVFFFYMRYKLKYRTKNWIRSHPLYDNNTGHSTSSLSLSHTYTHTHTHRETLCVSLTLSLI